MSVHNGHRQRVKDRFLEQGFVGMHPHEILEFLLFFSIPRGDTNPTAHILIEKYGSIAKVFDAPYEELIEIDGIGANSAILIKSLPQFAREYSQSSCDIKIINSTEVAGEYFMPHFVGRTEETLFLLTLDNKGSVIKNVLVAEGSVNQVNINVRKIVELSLKHNSSMVIIAHNHPNGVALPSLADISATKKVKSALELVGITLFDHIIVANDDYVSLADSGQV